MQKNKVLLIILDGFGEGVVYPGNAAANADMTFYNKLKGSYPHTQLKAIGNAVGLPEGSMGGSEVGHYTIGAGKIVFQFLEEINKSIADGSFFEKGSIKNVFNNVQQNSTKLHFIGMISDKGVHSQIDHLYALIDMTKSEELDNFFIHCFTDGRDVKERTAKSFIEKIQTKLDERGAGKIATINGRYYSMDRDNNLDRTKKAYDLLTKGEGFVSSNPIDAIQEAYDRGDKTDYYIQPIVLEKDGLIDINDEIIFFNFRTDRARQLTEMFVENKYSITCFGPYTDKAPVVFPAPEITENIGKIISDEGLTQLRTAETEKYAHVTYFLNSQHERPYKNEDRIMIDSKKVESFAEKPEMSAAELTDSLLKQIETEKYDFIAVNYANPDLVGHSGEYEPSVECCKVIDKCLEKLIPKAIQSGYTTVLTADHGNVEQMINDDGSNNPSHSYNSVPFVLIDDNLKSVKLKDGEGLASVGSTVLKLLGIKPKTDMATTLIED